MTLSRVLPLLLLASTMLVACDTPHLPGMQGYALESFQDHNRNKLDDVRARLFEHDPGQLAAIYLKVAFPVDRRGVRDELLWVQVVSWQDDRVEGVVINEPVHRTDIQAGSYVAFGPDRIVDYQESDLDGATRGNALDTLLDGHLGATPVPEPAP